MKICTLFAAALLLPFGGVFAQSGDYTINKVTASMIPTPDINFSGANRRTPKSASWLEVEVDFNSNADFTDELTFKYYIVVNAKAGRVLLTGDVTHVTILRGRGLMSVAYVPPKPLMKLLEKEKPSDSDIYDVGVVMVKGGETVAIKSMKAPGAEAWWEQASSEQTISGLVLNKDQTPFAALYWDRYEPLKPSGR